MLGTVFGQNDVVAVVDSSHFFGFCFFETHAQTHKPCRGGRKNPERESPPPIRYPPRSLHFVSPKKAEQTEYGEGRWPRFSSGHFAYAAFP